MIRRTPRSTRTATLFHDTPLFRSAAGEQSGAGLGVAAAGLPAPAHAARQPGLRRAGVRLRAAVKEPTTRTSGRTTPMRNGIKAGLAAFACAAPLALPAEATGRASGRERVWQYV